jgi:tetratricopeptide (TPR) repeat protein
MSLLLEALKKAERAKEEAQRRAQGESALSIVAPSPVEVEPEQEREPRAEPDAQQSFEIVADAPEPNPPAARPQPALALADEKPRSDPPASPRAQPRADAQAGQRAAARKVFEAKFRESNPRLPFFITLGALGVFALGTVVYFWMQLRPPAPLANLNPKPPAGEVALAVAAPAQPVAAAKPAAPLVPLAPLLATPATPAVPVATPVRPAPKLAQREPETPLLRPQPRTAESEISASRAAPQVHPRVGSAYSAYLAGDFATARNDYQQALREEPANRDAMLGLAALDVRGGRLELAEAAYMRLLHTDPRDAHAQAALIALRAGRVDPVAAESRMKSMLADNPAAHVLNFTLGNQFAQQGRWAEAQQEFFKALAAEPDNADFAYNLAVSLDQLRQPRLALQYYQRALALAKVRGASFDAAAAEKRAAELPALNPSGR